MKKDTDFILNSFNLKTILQFVFYSIPFLIIASFFFPFCTRYYEKIMPVGLAISFFFAAFFLVQIIIIKLLKFTANPDKSKTINRIVSKLKEKEKSLYKEGRPFALLLRGFHESMLTNPPQNSYKVKSKLFDYVSHGIPFYLAEAINSYARPIAIDLPLMGYDDPNDYPEEEDKYGATKLTYINSSDENWKGIIKILTEKSYFMVLIPSATEGIKEELEIILENKLEYKLFVFMPHSNGKNAFLVEEEWMTCRNKFYEWGYNLPSYSSYGLIYTPNSDLSIPKDRMKQFSIQRKSKKENIDLNLPIYAMIRNLPPCNQKTSDAMEAITRYVHSQPPFSQRRNF